MRMPKIRLMGALCALAVAGVMGTDKPSCVQLTMAELDSCPCDDATLTFTLEGITTIADNTVNLAIVLDGSGSVGPDDFAKETAFAVGVVDKFEANMLFQNQGTASYVQYASEVSSPGTFNNAGEFKVHAESAPYTGGLTYTSKGILEAHTRLLQRTATASFMIVITDGGSTTSDNPGAAAGLARDGDITVFAVGVGDNVDHDELEAIGGSADNVFLLDDFDALNAALTTIVSMIEDTVIPCNPTNPMLAIEFSAQIVSSGSGDISGSTITFSAEDLDSMPANFDVVLDVCDLVPGESVTVSAVYSDMDGNLPDLSLLEGDLVVGEDFCEAPTEPPHEPPHKPQHKPPHPPQHQPPRNPPQNPPRKPQRPPPQQQPHQPSRRDPHKPPRQSSRHPPFSPHPKPGWPRHYTYLGCFVDGPRERCLSGAISSSGGMTAQMCADTCSSSRYFGMSKHSECVCGDSQPSTEGGVCDYECSGDDTACGGPDVMTVFVSDD